MKIKKYIIWFVLGGTALASGLSIDLNKVETDLKLEEVKDKVQEVKEVDDLRCDRAGQNCTNLGKVKKYYYVGEKMSDKTSLELVGEKGLAKVKEDYGYAIFEKPNGEKVWTHFFKDSRIKDNNGDFYSYESATTTKEQYEKASKVSLIDKLFRPATAQSPATFYPDPTNTSSTDDNAGREATETWANIIAGAGTTQPAGMDISSWCSGNSTNFTKNYRGFIFFDTSSLPEEITITSATSSLYGSWKSDLNSLEHNIFGATVVSDTTIAISDYQSIGSTAFSSAKTTASWSTAGYNDFALNQDGIDNITTSGVSKFAFYISNTPTGVASSDGGVQAHNSSYTGTTRDPKLVITYTEGGATPVTTQTSNPILFGEW